MFFQFSPPVRQKIKDPPKKVEEPEETVLTLAPFTPNPKITFDNVKIGETATAKLVIKNPKPNVVKISVQITPSEDINLHLNWFDKEILGEDVVVLQWRPTKVGVWREILHVSDGGRISRDVPVILKSVSLTKSKTEKKSLPKYITKKNSPINKYRRKSPQKRLQPLIIPSFKLSPPQQNFENKENIPNFKNFCLIPENLRRETFTVCPKVPSQPEIFDDSLEDSFESKLRSVADNLTPKCDFNPGQCSTEEKSLRISNNSTFSAPRTLFLSTSDKNATFDFANLSGETYVKNNSNVANISSETYVKGNLSSETYVKANLSSETYTNESPRLTEFKTPPNYSQQERLKQLSGTSVKDTIEANLWSNNRPLKFLQPITEESSFTRLQPIPLKRKSDITFSAIPAKKPNLLENEWSSISTITVWQIDLETVQWLESQEENFKRWLNAILAPPTDLSANEQCPLDVAKLWRQCRQQDFENTVVILTNAKLDGLRKSARELYKSSEIQTILKKVFAAVDSERLSVRKDRDLHLDLKLQHDVISVLHSYNPVWLRLGLETICGRVIPLKNNSDVVGLSIFIAQNFIKNRILLKKYQSIYSPKYTLEIKKYILKKFLALVYFLDQAKMTKLIPHDPCLFCKNAPVKDSREALLAFSREILSSMGDITKYLKKFNYVVHHKQTYLDEFDYSVNNLGRDLRDGIRLTRVMEVILLDNSLREKLRVPADSRLRKVHNMKVVFDILEKQNFHVDFEITPKDLVDGHKEKTLSFLSQIIYTFKTPLMAKSVTVITKWWRSASILKKRHELKEIREKRDAAAKRIQNWYRNKKLLERLTLWRLKLKYCVQLFENIYLANKMMRIEREKFLILKSSVILIQRKWRATLAMKQEKVKFETQKEAATVIQRGFRAYLQRKSRRKSREEEAAIKIQSAARMFLQRRNFLKLKQTVLLVEEIYLANISMKDEREKFETLKSSTILIQRWWRATLTMREERLKFETYKEAVIIIQRRFRAHLKAKVQSEKYQKLRTAVVFIQRKWKAILARKSYQKLRSTTVLVQGKFRTKLQRDRYLKLRNGVIVLQRKWREILLKEKSAVKIQSCVRMFLARRYYQKLKKSVLLVEETYLAQKFMKIDREKFSTLKSATIVIQKKWRATLAMREERVKFEKQKLSAVIIQRRFRAKTVGKRQRQMFEKLKNGVVTLQRKWKEILQKRREKESAIKIQSCVRMFLERRRYQKLKQSVWCIEKHYLALKLMKIQREKFVTLKSAALSIQRKWRATLEMKQKRTEFEKQRRAAVILQRRFKAKLVGRRQREIYEKLRSGTVVIQRQWRKILRRKQAAVRIQSYVRMFLQRKRYQKLKQSVLCIEEYYRAQKFMKIGREKFLTLKTAATVIQRKWRATIAMRQQKEEYKKQRRAAVVIQRRFRAKVMGRRQCEMYEKLRNGAIIIQRQWRRILQMRREIAERHQAAIRIQSCVRMFMFKRRYQKLKKSVLIIEEIYLARKSMKIQREEFESLRTATILIQRKWRATVTMMEERANYRIRRQAAVIIQQRFRAYVKTKIQCGMYKKLKSGTIKIQRKWREILQLRKLRQKSAIKIQSCVRMFLAKEKYQKLKKTVLFIEETYQAKKLMTIEQENFANLKKSTVSIQRKWRATRAMRVARTEYQTQRRAAILIQKRWRATILMKAEMKNLEEMKKQRQRDGVLITQFQKYVRGFLVRRKYAPFLTEEAKEERRQLRLQNCAASKIQAFWRGYKERISRTPKLLEIYERLKKANKAYTPENTLGARCKKVTLQLIKDNPSVSHMLFILEELDFITRRDRESCTKLAPMLPKVLYKTVVATNRSPPEMKVCAVAGSILINFYRYSPTRCHTWVPDYIDGIITVMLHFCDYETPVFPTLATLLWFFLQTTEYKSVIIASPRFKEKISQIQIKVERKAKMINKMNVKYKSFFHNCGNLVIPSIVPDWGLEFTDKPKVFTNSVFAFQCILNLLT